MKTTRSRTLIALGALAAGVLGLSLLPLGASAQQPTPLPKAAQMKEVAPPIATTLTPAARATITSRIAGRSVPISALTGTMAVSVTSPIYSVAGVKKMTLSAVSSEWNNPLNGPSRSYIRIGATPATGGYDVRPKVNIEFAAEAGTRYIVICDMWPNGALWRASIGGDPAAFSWEGSERTAMLVPLRDRAGTVTVSFRVDPLPPGGTIWTPGNISRCEVSPIRI